MPERFKSPNLIGTNPEKKSVKTGNGFFSQWLVLLVIGFITTGVMVVFVRGLEDQTARSDFATAAEQRMVLLDSSIQRSVDNLEALGAYFDATSLINRGQFKTLVDPILKRSLSLQALEWIPLLQGNEVKIIEEFTRKEGFAAFELKELGPDKKMQPLSPRPEYYPVWFVEPFKGNEKALGFDLGSNPARMDALQTARKKRRSIATARISLVQETSKQFGFLIFRPVFVNAETVGTRLAPGILPINEIGRLRGFVLGVFRIGRMVEMQDQNKVDSAKPMQIYLFDELGKPGERLLYPQDGRFDSEEQLPDSAIKRSILVGGRTWIAAATPFGNAYSVDRTASWVMALTGLLLSILGAILQKQTLGKAQSIENIVAERTRSQQETEQRLIQANQEALEASRMKTIFLASMSHEFRTPMNAVLGLLHVLSRTPLSDSQKDYVTKITGAAKRLLRLIEDILDVSRIEAGKLSIEQSSFKIETVFRDVLVAVSPKLRGSEVELIVDIDPVLPAELVGDAMRLTQVMVNLVDNAAKFTSQGHIVMTARSEKAAEGRVYLHVSVKDTGVGMPQEECDRLFQPFVQADSMNRKRFGGTGLGLAICRQLVELMGGEIQASSALGQGSHFQFSIPLGVINHHALCAPRAEFADLNILLLESHELSGASLERLLENMGAKVTRVSSYGAARASLTLFEGAIMLIAQGFPDADQLIEMAQAHPTLRTVSISATGASAGDTGKHYEKPLLPHTVCEILVDKKETSLEAPKETVALPTPQPNAFVVESLTNMSFSSECTAQLQTLKRLLSEGDPQAEHCARELVKISAQTALENLAERLLVQCNNYDFRKALACLEEELPPEIFKERIQ